MFADRDAARGIGPRRIADRDAGLVSGVGQWAKRETGYVFGLRRCAKCEAACASNVGVRANRNGGSVLGNRGAADSNRVSARRSRTLQVENIAADCSPLFRSGRYAAVRRLRERQPSLKALYMSGYAEPEVLARQDGAETDDAPVLAKPFTARDLGATLRRVLDA